LPTDGTCRAAASYVVDEGHFGDVNLAGVITTGLYSWPGPIHEGKGSMQLIIDENASPAQRDAMLKIMQGEETEPMATMWSVFTAMVTTIHEPLIKPIHFVVDVDARTAQLSIPGIVESSGEPIRNPVTGKKHRARIDLPNGFEYSLAEMGSGTTKATGDIELDFESSYGQFARLHLSPTGPIRAQAA
jgi:hypothetical protein